MVKITAECTDKNLW